MNRSRKSAGVTSDTNQGIDFGLKEQKVTHVPEIAGTKNSLKDDLRYVGSVCDEEICENKIGKELIAFG